MKQMSFAMTTAQVLDRSKTVTRRVGWLKLKAGELIQAVEKSQGLKKGETARKLAVLRVVEVRREPLEAITQDDVIREGFPDTSTEAFIAFFMDGHDLDYRSDAVTRIEFEYVDGGDR